VLVLDVCVESVPDPRDGDQSRPETWSTANKNRTSCTVPVADVASEPLQVVSLDYTGYPTYNHRHARTYKFILLYQEYLHLRNNDPQVALHGYFLFSKCNNLLYSLTLWNSQTVPESNVSSYCTL
jgi:hypothetical protein